jgi:hypothetical protein
VRQTVWQHVSPHLEYLAARQPRSRQAAGAWRMISGTPRTSKIMRMRHPRQMISARMAACSARVAARPMDSQNSVFHRETKPVPWMVKAPFSCDTMPSTCLASASGSTLLTAGQHRRRGGSR